LSFDDKSVNYGMGINKTIDIRKNKTDNLLTPCLSVDYNDAILKEI